MWIFCLLLSAAVLVGSAVCSLLISRSRFGQRHHFNLFYALFAGVFLSAFVMFLPVHSAGTADTVDGWRTFFLSVFTSMQIFTIGCEFAVVTDGMASCPAALSSVYQAWVALLFALAPIFTFGFVLSLFKNLSAYGRYLRAFFSEVYVFSELNEHSLVLARDLQKKHKKAAIVFTDVFEENDERSYELNDRAKEMGAICFRKDLLAVDFHLHAKSRPISFFTIGGDESENLNQALRIVEAYRERAGTRLYVFSTKVESELLLTDVDKGGIKVRRINPATALISRMLYDDGHMIFDSAVQAADGMKDISAVVVGMGRHGTEMVKSLAWFCQMNGYRAEIHAFDKDPAAEDRFTALAPELMSPLYNGVTVEGEAQYKITVHPGTDVDTASFTREIRALPAATFVLVALGSDDLNINAAVRLRMLFAQQGMHPVIRAIVYSTEQKKALTGIKNYRGQPYDIDFIGDLESSFTEAVIVDSDLEADALARHLKWGKEEDFWNYEYNYRSSVASAIHMRARVHCGMPGAGKREEELTAEERDLLEVLEHRRWNAYMRSEGYIFSGSTDKKSRNDLAKMHHDLVDFSLLTEEEKRKDGSVGSL